MTRSMSGEWPVVACLLLPLLVPQPLTRLSLSRVSTQAARGRRSPEPWSGQFAASLQSDQDNTGRSMRRGTEPRRSSSRGTLPSFLPSVSLSRSPLHHLACELMCLWLTSPDSSRLLSGLSTRMAESVESRTPSSRNDWTCRQETRTPAPTREAVARAPTPRDPREDRAPDRVPQLAPAGLQAPSESLVPLAAAAARVP